MESDYKIKNLELLIELTQTTRGADAFYPFLKYIKATVTIFSPLSYWMIK